MFRRRSKVSRAEVEQWVLRHPAYDSLKEDEKERVIFVVERMARIVSRQGEQAVFYLQRLTDAWVAQVLSERADKLAIDAFTKENLDMSHKARERERKSAAGLAELSETVPEKRRTGGLASRYRAFMKRTEGIEEEAIAETERYRAMQASEGFSGAASTTPSEGEEAAGVY